MLCFPTIELAETCHKKYAQDDDIWLAHCESKDGCQTLDAAEKKARDCERLPRIIVICWKTLLLRLESILALASHANRGVLAVKIDETHKYKNLYVLHRLLAHKHIKITFVTATPPFWNDIVKDSYGYKWRRVTEATSTESSTNTALGALLEDACVDGDAHLSDARLR